MQSADSIGHLRYLLFGFLCLNLEHLLLLFRHLEQQSSVAYFKLPLLDHLGPLVVCVTVWLRQFLYSLGLGIELLTLFWLWFAFPLVFQLVDYL